MQSSIPQRSYPSLDKENHIAQHEILPQITRLERFRLDTISSLNFAEFHGLHGDIRNHPEAHIIYKGVRVLEFRLEALLRQDQEDEATKKGLFRVYLKLGHLNLLAMDYGRALSAFQHALKCRPLSFWKDPGAYYGLGLVYLHFKAYQCAIDAFNHTLYTCPTVFVAVEIHARLGVAYKAIQNYTQALKHFNAALHDVRESSFLSKTHLKLNIAITHDSAGDLDKAYAELQALLTPENQLNAPFQASVYRQLGWLCYRSEFPPDSEQRQQKLLEAERHLLCSKQLEPNCGKTHYYLGRCYGQTQNRAHDAFVNYRHSIDKSEADADTWCSIGVLYQQQRQPMDALQAFICAVDLDPENSAAWTNLGQLYEEVAQYQDALACYRNAIKYNPVAPEQLKARIAAIEKELASVTPAASRLRPQERLPVLRDAPNQPIPSELRQRQEDFSRQKQIRYREGASLWKMGELATFSVSPTYDEHRPLDPTQLNMLNLLKANQNQLNESEQLVLRNLEARYRELGSLDTDYPLSHHTVSSLPLDPSQSLFDLSDWDGTKQEVVEENTAPHPATPTDLPAAFSLLSRLNVPQDITAREILDLSQRRVDRPADFVPLFEERCPPPRPPSPPMAEKNAPLPTPLIMVESGKDAHSLELQRFCEKTPIALIRGLTGALKMDLSLFSTKTLLETAPTDDIEIRSQYKMPVDVNVDHLGNRTWACNSSRSYSTIEKYAAYQADTFKLSLKEEAEKLRGMSSKYGAESQAKKRKIELEQSVNLKPIKFGTNVDLSDETKFKAQLNELAKMPPFCRLIAGCNLLSHLGHTVYGMNTVQLYMKVPGSRTPGHQENNNLASVNINIGPGDCEWFGVPAEYWGAIDRMCREQGLDYLKGSWWPNYEELVKARIPVHRFTQKAGDMVWIGTGCIHWVQATGWCNNVAWNVGPITPMQMTQAVASYEWNRLQSFKSLVPMQHLCWQLAKNVRFTNQQVYSLVRGVLIRSLAYAKMVADYAESQHRQIKMRPREKGENAHYCSQCEVEVFSILFVKEVDQKFMVICVDCARRGNLSECHVLQQISFGELSNIFDGFTMHASSKISTLVA